jgi:hypothetical protein
VLEPEFESPAAGASGVGAGAGAGSTGAAGAAGAGADGAAELSAGAPGAAPGAASLGLPPNMLANLSMKLIALPSYLNQFITVESRGLPLLP